MPVMWRNPSERMHIPVREGFTSHRMCKEAPPDISEM